MEIRDSAGLAIGNITRSMAFNWPAGERPPNVNKSAADVGSMEFAYGFAANERVVITKIEFRRYETKFFGKLKEITQILEVIKSNKTRELQAAEEAKVESQYRNLNQEQRDRRGQPERNRNTGNAASAGAIIGVMVGLLWEYIEPVITGIINFIRSVVDWVTNAIEAVRNTIRGILDALSNVTNMIPPEVRQGIERIAPLASPLTLMNPVAAANLLIRPPSPNTAETTANLLIRPPSPNTAETTSFSTPNTPNTPNVSGIPQRTTVNGVASITPRQAEMIRFAQTLNSPGGPQYQVSSGYRPGAGPLSGHGERGFSIDIVTNHEPSDQELLNIWRQYHEHFNMPVDVLYEYAGQTNETGSVATGNHIHVEVDPVHARDLVRRGRTPITIPPEMRTSTPTQVPPPTQEVPRTGINRPRSNIFGSRPAVNIPASLNIDPAILENAEQFVINHPPQVITNNNAQTVNTSKPAPEPKDVPLVVRNAFVQHIDNIRRESIREKDEGILFA